MRLYLVQHAQAKPKEEGPARPPPRRKGEYHCFKKGEMAKCLWEEEMLPLLQEDLCALW